MSTFLMILFLSTSPTIESVMAESSTTHIRAEAIQEATDPAPELGTMGKAGAGLTVFSMLGVGVLTVAGHDADDVSTLIIPAAIGMGLLVVDALR